MKLPNAHLAIVPEEKVTRYLLNSSHPAGGSKASFFLRFGFTVSKWHQLAQALLKHAQENEISSGADQTQHGVRYVVDGPLVAPGGQVLNVRSAWYIDVEGSAPRFVTAHPLPRK